MLSRNSESSRALPTELQIDRVLNSPYIPEFRERVKGMGGGEFLTGARKIRACAAWLEARDNAVETAKKLLTVAKDEANRVLEPFAWHTAIVTATEWDNFFNLRIDEGAAIPMQRIATLMREAMWMSAPQGLKYGEWHLPLVARLEYDLIGGHQQLDGAPHGVPYAAGVSAGRCARSSYSNQHQPETAGDSVGRWGKLAGMGHWSPGEHTARCQRGSEPIGNFVGWQQLRKFYPSEAVYVRG